MLIVTNRPAIANSWFDDFDKFIAWQTNYAFVSTNDSLKNRPVLTRKNFLKKLLNGGKDRMIAFISLQDLKGAISFGGSHDKLKWVKDLNWDLLVIDEAHEGVDTFRTNIAFENIKRNFTLYLSGIPFKALASGKFSDKQIFNWSYADEQNAKSKWNYNNGDNPYSALPRLNLFSYQMSQMVTNQVNQGVEINGKNFDFAFDLNEFFETKGNGQFVHEKEVKKWLDTLSKNSKYPFSTPQLREELKHTFWLLNRVNSAKALKKLLEKHPVFKDYKIILVAGKNSTDDDQLVNAKSLDRVKKAIATNDKTITLSVGQLTTGITIPEWTAVLILSNLKSPSLYMQAAFRAQNPWSYQSNGERKQKKNSYIFDFAPERTLTIYDEFANNLSNKTINGNGTSIDRRTNIKTLLNFFPVIAEDKDGKMISLDVNQVLTIPKQIKSQEVVKRGFMSNLLFQNISGIFASAGAREILENLNPVDKGQFKPRHTDDKTDPGDVKVDEDNEVIVEPEKVLSQTEALFGPKIYGDIQKDIIKTIKDDNENLSYTISQIYKKNTKKGFNQLAKENGLSKAEAKQEINNGKNEIERQVKDVKKQNEIKQNETTVEHKKAIAQAENNPEKIAKLKEDYQNKQKELQQEFQEQVTNTVKHKTEELIQNSTKELLKQAEEKKKNSVEEDVRARLRGFARTIPSFLMAYGTPATTLENFDTTIKDSVFKEVTGISLEQFRTLRDTYQFFDPIVFNESVKEFLLKRKELANYFDENQKEDIFDYIPPQQTNQIFTPKKVVQMMIDKLEEENPNIFSDPNKTFVDLYLKSGLYLTEIVKRLYVGLKDKIPNENQRLKHILEKQIYGFAPTEIIYNIARNYVFGFNENAKNIDSSHLVFLDTIPFARKETKISLEEKCDELFGGNK